jgi:mannosylglycerate hydrolase
MKNIKPPKQFIGHVVSHTHWDREWRVPIWYSRGRLIRMFDSLLESLEKDPGFKHFLFDGQVVGVEDYLAFKPENRIKVGEFIKANRIQIGPWYNLPDEYPVCGEALIRNLLVGIERANKLGRCLKVAYLSFGWGQTAQLPQILAGFGIDFVVVGKNVSPERAPHSEFYWEGSDNTRLLATRLGDEGRANFYFAAIMPAMYGMSYHDPECKIAWGRQGWMWRRASETIDLEMTCERQKQYHSMMAKQCLEKAWHTTDNTLIKSDRFFGNGTDSTAPAPFLGELISDMNKLDAGCQLIHSGIEEYAEAVKKGIRELSAAVPVVHGELRDGPSFKVSGNALATRMPLKSLNRKAQHRLIRYAEPLASIAGIWGIEYPGAFTDKAWHYLLLAHSHDAINGVTLDKTAGDTAYKLEQTIELAEFIVDHSISELLKKIDLPSFDKDDVLIAVFNLSNKDAGYIIKALIDMPEECNSQWVDIADSDGNLSRVQPLGSTHIASPVNVVNSRALPFYCDRHEMYFDTGIIPTMGYKVFKALPHGVIDRKTEFWNNVYDLGTQLTGPNRMANEFLELTFNSNGTFDLLHKASNKMYRSLHYFEDSGDAGDYWQRVSPWKNTVFTTLNCDAKVYLVEDGPLVTSFMCEWTMSIPQKMFRNENRRDDTQVPLVIGSQVTLRAHTPYLEIKTNVRNQAMDHRLRACFPTYIAAQNSAAQGHFNIDIRPIERGRDKQGIRDDGMGTLPMQNFVDLSDGSNGLALLNRNIIEYEISDDAGRTAFLTLLRCVPMRICTEHRCATQDSSQTGPQCFGEYTFEYALYPHQKDVWSGNVYEITEHYLMQSLIYQFSKHTDASSSLPLHHSFVKIRPARLQIAAFKKAQNADSYIIRLYNPSDSIISGELAFTKEPKTIELVNFNEEPIRRLDANNGSLNFTFESNKIVTFCFTF